MRADGEFWILYSLRSSYPWIHGEKVFLRGGEGFSVLAITKDNIFLDGGAHYNVQHITK